MEFLECSQVWELARVLIKSAVLAWDLGVWLFVKHLLPDSNAALDWKKGYLSHFIDEGTETYK